MIKEISLFGFNVDWYLICLIFSLIYSVSFFNFHTYKITKSRTFCLKISIHILTSSFLISKVTSFIEFLISHHFSLHNFYLHRLGNRFFGVVLFEIIFIYFITRKQFSLKILDILSQSTAMGLVIGKLGCYLSGHGCFGIQGFGFLFSKSCIWLFFY